MHAFARICTHGTDMHTFVHTVTHSSLKTCFPSSSVNDACLHEQLCVNNTRETQVEKERQELAVARQQLEEDQQKFAEETSRVASVLSDSEQVCVFYLVHCVLCTCAYCYIPVSK